MLIHSGLNITNNNGGLHFSHTPRPENRQGRGAGVLLLPHCTFQVVHTVPSFIFSSFEVHRLYHPSPSRFISLISYLALSQLTNSPTHKHLIWSSLAFALFLTFTLPFRPLTTIFSPLLSKILVTHTGIYMQ